jgi:uncharacterized membrane protein YeaQ/YmgE (transglycosylase-associated protein family)
MREVVLLVGAFANPIMPGKNPGGYSSQMLLGIAGVDRRLYR